MLPKGVRHMLVAGRAVSSEVAALAAFNGTDPREVSLDSVRQRLTSIGHIVP